MKKQQSTSSVLMVRPACFYSNPETAITNEFQDTDAQIQLSQVLDEFDSAVATLRDAGVTVVVVQDTEEPETPDAVFPNNWFTTHADGQCVLYPMQPMSRRAERRTDVMEILQNEHGFNVRHVLDWSDFEHRELFLEGTGSLILDRSNKIAYACRSPRTHDEVLQQFCQHFGYTPVVFDALGSSGQSIYHTNVMMCVGTGYAVVCLAAVKDLEERALLTEHLNRQHQIIDISYEQMNQFAGNMLELVSPEGERLLVMSARAEASLNAEQRSSIGHFARIIACPVNSIEDAAGGSIRCMLAEIFLPKQAA